MPQLIIQTLATLALIALSVVPVGLLGLWGLERKWQFFRTLDGKDRLLLVILIGFCWSAAWLYAANLSPIDFQSARPLCLVKSSLEVIGAMVILFLTVAGRSRREPGGAAPIWSLSWFDLAGCCLALLLAAGSIYINPVAMDNAALYWLAREATTGTFHPDGSQGSPFYIAALLTPSVLLSGTFTIGNMAAGIKVISYLVLWFATRYFCEKGFARSKRVVSLLIFFLVLDSMIGEYGLFRSGKETPIGMLFLVPFFALLIRPPKNEDTPWKIPLILGVIANLAIGFAAVTIPYLALIYALYLFQGRKGLRSIAALLLTGGFTIPFSFASMLHFDMGVSLLVYWAGIVLLTFLVRLRSLVPSDFLTWFEKKKTGFWLTAVIGLVAIGVLFVMLPVRYDATPYYPIDGTARLSNLIFGLPHQARIAPYLAVSGLLVMAWTAFRSRHQGIAVFLAFPWSVLAIVVAIASLQIKDLPFHTQHLWDLAKDIPNWWLPLYFAIGAGWLFVAMGPAVTHFWQHYSRIPGSHWLARYGVASVVLSIALYMANDIFRNYYRFDRKPVRVGTAIHSEVEFATAADLYNQVLHLPEDLFANWPFHGIWTSDLGNGVQLWTEPTNPDYTSLLQGVGGRVHRFDPAKDQFPFSGKDQKQWQLALLDDQTVNSIPPEVESQLVRKISPYSGIYVVGDVDSAAEALKVIGE